MVMVFEGTENQYSMDGYLKDNLDLAKKIIKKDWDMVFLYDGYEGSGKSVKAMQDAYYCDPTLTVKRIVFNPDDFKRAIYNAKKYEAIVYDEAYGGLSSKDAMNSVNKSIVQMLTVIRAKNLFIFIVLPSFFDLNKYVAVWRSRALIHVYSGQNFQRGFFRFYNMNQKKAMYIQGKKYYDYKTIKPNFYGKFTNHYTVNEKEYRKKKDETSVEIENENPSERKDVIIRKERIKILNNLYTMFPKITNVDCGKILGVSSPLLPQYKREMEETKMIEMEKKKSSFHNAIKSLN